MIILKKRKKLEKIQFVRVNQKQRECSSSWVLEEPVHFPKKRKKIEITAYFLENV